jgi:hypothetical protein
MLHEADCEKIVYGILGLTAPWVMQAAVNCPTLAQASRPHSQFYHSLLQKVVLVSLQLYAMQTSSWHEYQLSQLIRHTDDHPKPERQ